MQWHAATYQMQMNCKENQAMENVMNSHKSQLDYFPFL